MALIMANRFLWVDSGRISVLPEEVFSKYGIKESYSEKKYSGTELINIKKGKYKIKLKIAESWNGAISKTKTIKTDGGRLYIGDPCYIVKDWDRFCDCAETKKRFSNFILVDTGGDGDFPTEIIIENAEDAEEKTKNKK